VGFSTLVGTHFEFVAKPMPGWSGVVQCEVLESRRICRTSLPLSSGGTAASRERPGLRLGLTLAQRIVEAHGGTIRLDSAPDRGTTVTILLPLDPPTAAAASA